MNTVAEIAAMLDADVGAHDVVANDAELRALHRYQSRDRAYELINGLLRRKLDPETIGLEQLELINETVTALNALVRRWRVPEALRVFRGLRRRDVEALDPGANPVRSFVSTTLDRDVAVREFMVPPGPTGPAMMEIDVPAGVPAIWVPPFGVASLAYQHELILDRRVRIVTGRRRTEGDTLVVDCEVLL